MAIEFTKGWDQLPKAFAGLQTAQRLAGFMDGVGPISVQGVDLLYVAEAGFGVYLATNKRLPGWARLVGIVMAAGSAYKAFQSRIPPIIPPPPLPPQAPTTTIDAP